MEGREGVSAFAGNEFELLDMLIDKEDVLPYPLVKGIRGDGASYAYYEIPDEKREEVLAELYPFVDVPALDARRFDLHENRWFDVGEFLVIRQNGRNYLVSPYYPHSGGTVLDWVTEAALKQADEDGFLLNVIVKR